MMAKAENDNGAPVRPCPICGKPAEPRWRPFCSKRCADVDLNRWLSGSYAIPAVEDEAEADDEARPVRPPRDASD